MRLGPRRGGAEEAHLILGQLWIDLRPKRLGAVGQAHLLRFVVDVPDDPGELAGHLIQLLLGHAYGEGNGRPATNTDPQEAVRQSAPHVAARQQDLQLAARDVGHDADVGMERAAAAAAAAAAARQGHARRIALPLHGAQGGAKLPFDNQQPLVLDTLVVLLEARYEKDLIPHTEQKRCRAVPVLNVYMVSTSSPRMSLNRSAGTIRCR